MTSSYLAWALATEHLVFPSPCGEKVGVTLEKYHLDVEHPQFPSPCGEKVGVTKKFWAGRLTNLGFPSPCGEKVGVTEEQQYDVMNEIVFPSPCGEKVGVTSLYLGTIKESDLVSVPLRGKGWGDGGLVKPLQRKTFNRGNSRWIVEAPNS